MVGAGGDVLSVSWTNYFFFYKNMINLCSQTIYVVLITFVLFWFCSEIFSKLCFTNVSYKSSAPLLSTMSSNEPDNP